MNQMPIVIHQKIYKIIIRPNIQFAYTPAIDEPVHIRLIIGGIYHCFDDLGFLTA